MIPTILYLLGWASGATVPVPPPVPVVGAFAVAGRSPGAVDVHGTGSTVAAPSGRGSRAVDVHGFPR